MKHKLILSDIDGTLLRRDRRIGEATKRSIRNAIADGHHFALATGRMHGGGRIVTLDLDYDGFLISCNGAYAEHLKTGEVLYSMPLDRVAVREIVRICRRFGVYYHLYSPRAILAGKDASFARRYADGMAALPESHRFEVRFTDRAEDEIEELEIHKAAFWDDDPAVMRRIAAEIESIGSFAACKSYATSFDIMAEGVSKAVAVDALCRRYGLRRSDVIAFGDNDNDVDMIQAAGIGVAMGGSSEALIQAADFVTRSSDEDGIAAVLENLEAFLPEAKKKSKMQ